MTTTWLVITPLEQYEFILYNMTEQEKEELAMCVEEQFSVKELK